MPIRAVIFVGPTLSRSNLSAGSFSGLTWKPPAKRGDIYLAAQAGVKLIGLIDGYFRNVPSPQHKEILWAIDKGCTVIGAASMGALRAAELSEFGMIGIGKVFEDFAAQRLRHDDEVAIEHGPAELGYLATSESLVNLRYTLAHAVERGWLATKVAEVCITIAEEMYFADRSLNSVIERYNHSPDSRPISPELVAYLTRNRVDQKATDATELVELVSRLIVEGIGDNLVVVESSERRAFLKGDTLHLAVRPESLLKLT